MKPLLSLLLMTVLISPLVQADTTLGTKNFGAEQTYLNNIYSQVGHYQSTTAPQLAQSAIQTYFSALLQQAQSLNTQTSFPAAALPAKPSTTSKTSVAPVIPAAIPVTTQTNTANTNSNTNKPIPSGFGN